MPSISRGGVTERVGRRGGSRKRSWKEGAKRRGLEKLFRGKRMRGNGVGGEEGEGGITEWEGG